ncbi:unnamed protein product [Blumeria hordei]|uniref:FAD/NAD(P)-binding domain-containing protein n=1 Tax=Blumeria hordei TaxID=2867405 RepID=A0A383UYS7_BLUHO|nr:unnamed protein product [Blumeria hordei]
MFEAVVVGAGPAGIAVVGNFLEQKKSPILWVDDEFKAGRLNKHYREVPSNAKVKLFVEFADELLPFREIVRDTPSPNAYTKLRSLPQSSTCRIADAADLCQFLTNGLENFNGVEKLRGKVTSASWSSSDKWSIKVHSPSSGISETSGITAKILVLCTGSKPITEPLPFSNLQTISLDTALKPSILPTVFSSDEKITVAVIGASHRAILVLRNLYHLACSTHPNLQIKWFTRHPLRYAEERDGWILHDNTGLKAEVATWARENLEESQLVNSDVGKYLQKIATSRASEKDDYQKHLPSCTHIVQAIGFQRNEVPTLERDGRRLDLTFNQDTQIFEDEDGQKISRLYGAGIAWPERVTDPEGNVSSNVGMWEFMTFLKRAVPVWTQNISAPSNKI